MHNEALAMRESVLEFRSRVLPEKNPDISEGHMKSVVHALCRTGRDAFAYDDVQQQP